jgi:hypothetical protein
MDYGLLIIGIGILFISYMVGIKHQTWLLAGFNEKNIKNKSLLGKIAGGVFFLPLGLLVVVHSFIDYPNETTVLVVAMIVLLTTTYVYINKYLLE